MANYNANISDKLSGVLFNHTHKKLIIQGSESKYQLQNLTGVIPEFQEGSDDKITKCYLSGFLHESINIPILQSMPIGSVISLLQVKINNQWFPKVPYGFYELSKQISVIPINANNINSKQFNLPLAYLIFRAKNQLQNLFTGNIFTFTLPAKAPIHIDDTHQIIYIIKYNFFIFSRD